MNNKKIEIIYVNIDDIKPYENNPRFNDNAVEYVKKSIENFGFKVPIVLDKNNTIVCGHTRVKSALELGIKEIPVIYADDLTEEQIKEFRLVDNKVGELAEWDYELLDQELADIDIDMTDFGFEDYEEIKKPEVVEDNYEVEIPEEPKTKIGDIYKLGDHILMCGDSTELKDVEKLCGGVRN